MTDEKAARLAAIRAANAGHSPAATRRPDVVSSAAGDDDDMPPGLALQSVLLILLAAAAGALGAVVVLPAWLPRLSDSLLGAEPKAYWYLSRASAFVAYALLWLSMALGLTITNRLARLWPGGPAAFDLHQHASLLGLAFALFHGLILLGDRYIGYTLASVLVPFASESYRPAWVGLGQVALYLVALVSLSFFVKGAIGRQTWRLIHFLSFAAFALALLHGIMSGSDTAVGWARAAYWASGGSLLFLTVYRVLVSGMRRSSAASRPR